MDHALDTSSPRGHDGHRSPTPPTTERQPTSAGDQRALRRDAERHLARCLARGEPYAPAATTGRQRIRAGVLRELCSGPGACVHARGAQVSGVVLEGDLDLRHVALPFPLGLTDCDLTGDLVLTSAVAKAIELIDCRVAGTIDADRLEADVCDLTRTVAAGPLRLTGARLGELVLTGAHLLADPPLAATATTAEVGAGAAAGPHGCNELVPHDKAEALSAANLHVTGNVMLDGGFTARGPLRLTGTHVGGDLAMTKAQVGGVGRDGHAIDAARLGVGGDATSTTWPRRARCGWPGPTSAPT